MRIVCAGGGTLGSVTPLLAVIEELKQRGHVTSVQWFGTVGGPERQLVESCGLPYDALPAGKWRRYFSLRNISDAFHTLAGFYYAVWWFIQHPVDVVLTAGSYVAVPVGFAAAVCHVPVLAHQQDVEVGLANRLLARVASRFTVTFEASLAQLPKSKAVLTGNPVRARFTNVTRAAARAKLGLPAAEPVVAVLGGGTGAEFLNQLVEKTVDQLTASGWVLHLTGAGKTTAAARPRYRAMEFTTDSATVLAAADLVVSRAGLGVLTELAALSKAALIVPMPGTHQEANARVLQGAGAARVLRQSDLTPEAFVATVTQLQQAPTERVQLGAALHQLLPADATRRVADEVLNTVLKLN